MSPRQRAALAAFFIGLHLLILAPLVGEESPLVTGVFRADAEATLGGDRPYADRDFEYPPFALPLVWGPAALSDDPAGFGRLLAWEMLAVDLAIVLLLALGLPGRTRPVGPMAVYTAGVVLLSGAGPLPDSAIEDAALPLARFDLVPAGLVLAAVLARLASRSVAWGLLLGLGTAIKAFPVALAAILARQEARPGRAALGFALPLAAAGVLVVALGDDFASAVSYHAGRELQVESLAASPLLLAHLLGADATAEFSAGSWNLHAPGDAVARAASLVLAAAAYVAVVTWTWRRRVPLLEGATAALAVLVVLAPVLSPQFLLWILPLSAAAFGLRAPNLVLVSALGLTAWILNYYGGAAELADRFVAVTAIRNMLLVAYLALVLAAVWAASRPAAPGAPAAAGG